jgi:hypothetical protein
MWPPDSLKNFNSFRRGSKISMGSILIIMGTIEDNCAISLVFGGISLSYIHQMGLSIRLSDVLGLSP